MKTRRFSVCGWLLILALIVCLFPSCGNDPAAEVTTESTEAVTSETEAIDDGTKLRINLENLESVTVIRNEYSDKMITNAAMNLRTAINSAFGLSSAKGCRISVDYDYKPKDDGIAIVVGNTNLSESEPHPDRKLFNIKVSENRIYLTSATDSGVYDAIDYFISDILNNPDFRSGSDFVIDKNFEITKERKLTVGQLIYKDVTYKATHTELAEVLPRQEFIYVQGGCCDGEYYYSCIIKYNQKDETQNRTLIRKYDMKTWKVVKTSKETYFGHSNDMCWNSKLGQLIVVHNTPEAKVISFVDRDTLEVVKKVTLDRGIYSLSYCAERNQYVAGYGNTENVVIYDENFNPVRIITANVTGYVRQGNACDRDYIYMVYHLKNVLMVYDWDGNFVNCIDFNLPSGCEPEHIDVDGDSFIVGTNGTKRIFRMTIAPEK